MELFAKSYSIVFQNNFELIKKTPVISSSKSLINSVNLVVRYIIYVNFLSIYANYKIDIIIN